MWRALPLPCEDYLHKLIEKTPWRQEEITVWGKTHLQPRLSAWYSDGKSYTYSGLRLEPCPLTAELRQLKQVVESRTGYPFNSVLLNYYRDHRDSMGLHSDDEAELGCNPVIASLSLGATRRFMLAHKADRSIEKIHIVLADRDLLLMEGATQHYWKHALPKQGKPCGPRINLTFRQIL